MLAANCDLIHISSTYELHLSPDYAFRHFLLLIAEAENILMAGVTLGKVDVQGQFITAHEGVHPGGVDDRFGRCGGVAVHCSARVPEPARAEPPAVRRE